MTKIKQVEEFAVESMRALARMTRNPVITQRAHAIITRFRKKVAELDAPAVEAEKPAPKPKKKKAVEAE